MRETIIEVAVFVIALPAGLALVWLVFFKRHWLNTHDRNYRQVPEFTGATKVANVGLTALAGAICLIVGVWCLTLAVK